jgi:hypothetical protein
MASVVVVVLSGVTENLIRHFSFCSWSRRSPLPPTLSTGGTTKSGRRGSSESSRAEAAFNGKGKKERRGEKRLDWLTDSAEGYDRAWRLVVGDAIQRLVQLRLEVGVHIMKNESKSQRRL